MTKLISSLLEFWDEMTKEMAERKEFIKDGADYIMIIKI